jgi:hypothetical protein
MFTVYSWLTPALIVLGVVLVGVVVGLVWRGREGADRRPGPATYFLYGLSLVCLVVVLVGTGVGVHATAQAIGPNSSFPAIGNIEDFPPCPTADAATPATTIPPDQVPCLYFGQSESGLAPGPSQSSQAGSTAIGSGTLVAPVTDRNQYISAAVTAGLFALAGLIGYLVVWPRSRRVASESGADQGSIKQFGIAYGYVVAALSAVLLLLFVPLTVDNVFRAIAPGVNETSGHAEGIRGFVTFAVVSALATIGVLYHLRYANKLREPPLPLPEA